VVISGLIMGIQESHGRRDDSDLDEPEL